MRFFLSSTFIILIGCTPYPKKMGYDQSTSTSVQITNPYFSDADHDYVYKAGITFFDKQFGGILVIKKIKENNHRVVFTTEFGNTIFDFSFKDDDFKVNRILKEMDRKLLLNILEKDFRSLIKEHITPIDIYKNENKSLIKTQNRSKKYYYLYESDTLTQIARIANQKEKVVIKFSKISNNIVDYIQITHSNIKLQIRLTAI